MDHGLPLKKPLLLTLSPMLAQPPGVCVIKLTLFVTDSVTYKATVLVQDSLMFLT